ncbi:MAG: hypothetical protein WB696_10005 [Chthoniobacterales bacterium]
MTVEEIKGEIRTLSRGEKIEIYRWLDDGVVAEFSSRIGADGGSRYMSLSTGRCLQRAGS